MKQLACIILAITLLASAILFSFSTVDAYQYKSGAITADTTWTKADGPYRLSGTIAVYNGVTLTIEPGAVVDLYYFQIVVYGALVCRGTSEDKIVLYSSSSEGVGTVIFQNSTSWNDATNSGSIIESTVLSSASVAITACSPKISNSLFTAISQAISVSSGGSPLIINNIFDCRSIVITAVSGSATISNNFIKSSIAGSYAFGIYVANNSVITNNNITGCFKGIYVLGNSSITGNLITANNYGIDASNTALIQSNTIAKNTVGISGGGYIVNNTIGSNTYGLIMTINASSITKNNFYNNTINLAFTTNLGNLNATNNWWGTTDSKVINGTIQTLSSNKVTYVPYLTSQNPDAPTIETINYTPNPTPTPFITPDPVPSPAYTPYSTPRPTNSPSAANPTETPIQPTETPIPTPPPTPTPRVVPDSALSVTNDSLYGYLAQIDLFGIVNLVLISLGIMWAAIVLVTISHRVIKRALAKS